MPYVVMHWRGHSHDAWTAPSTATWSGEVCEELRRRVDAVVAAGVDPALIVLDPGLGFAKRPEHNWALLTHLAAVSQPGRQRSRRSRC